MAKLSSDLQAALDDVRTTGSDEALWQLVETYGDAILNVVRRRLQRQMRSKFDSADFVQMVWVSFFKDPQKLRTFDKPEDLVAYLQGIARHKISDETRRRKTQKYNVEREEPLDPSLPEHVAQASHQTPSQFAIARERWAGMMDTESERNRNIVQMRIQGASFVEIGQQLGIDESTARKVLERLVGVPFSQRAG